MTPEESQQALGQLLAEVLDDVDGRVVKRALIVYEIEEDDEYREAISYKATDGMAWPDHIGLMRTCQLHAEAVILRAHLDGENDDDPEDDE